ncbi:MAG: transcriptional repressor LexA [Alphaproteobacteria bacterium]|nr:transcriptional repressor LexA [Alphaproteobacteria bacterium]
MLTRKQHELLIFIQKRLADGGVSPSFDEMKDALNLRSKSGVHRLITALEERGFLRRLPHRARALELLRGPEATLPGYRPPAVAPAPPPTKFEPAVIKGSRGVPLAGMAPVQSANENMQLPLYGKIAAGTPVEALRDPTSYFELPVGLLASRREHYALQVEGDSMVDAGIHDGDVAVIERCETAENGAIVVALIDEQEATLKRLRRRGNSVALEPANASYETRIFPPDRVKVQGRLVGLYRRY